MVLRPRRDADLLPVAVVPDEQSWAAWGVDLAAEGVRPVFSPAAARGLVVPIGLDDALVAPLARYRERAPRDVVVRRLAPPATAADSPRPNAAQRPRLRREGDADPVDPGRPDQAHGHHGDMAIVGEPSADGLVMESIDVVYGPLGTPLPGGLVVRATLDGDVVQACSVTPTLAADRRGPADPLAPIACRLALRDARAGAGEPPDDARAWLAAVEIERAISHLAWLRSFARLLGWRRLVDACADALSSLLAARRPALADLDRLRAGGPAPHLLVDRLRRAREPVARASALVESSHGLRLRLAGLAPLSAREVRALGVRGPAARASGVADDVRTRDERYAVLDFAPVVGEAGDALARTTLRAREALGAIELALRICAADAVAARRQPAAPAPIEGPRGPLSARVDGERCVLDAPGAEPARQAAERAMAGREWSAALAGLASFDLSPVRIAP